MCTALVFEARAQSRFEAPVGLQTWPSTERAERGTFDGAYGGLLARYGGGARQDTADDAQRSAFRAAEIDPGILIYPDTLVDTSMVIPVPDLVDPHMILPPEAPRSIHPEESHDVPRSE
jgi:hypothetical protein